MILVNVIAYIYAISQRFAELYCTYTIANFDLIQEFNH